MKPDPAPGAVRLRVASAYVRPHRTWGPGAARKLAPASHLTKTSDPTRTLCGLDVACENPAARVDVVGCFRCLKIGGLV